MTRVLVVEDHPLNYQFTEAALEPMQAEIEWARDVPQALQMLDGTAFDLVILDWHLPDQSGEVLLEHITSLPGRPACIVLTADARPELRQRALSLGAHASLTKPITARPLLESVRLALASRGNPE